MTFGFAGKHRNDWAIRTPSLDLSREQMTEINTHGIPEKDWEKKKGKIENEKGVITFSTLLYKLLNCNILGQLFVKMIIIIIIFISSFYKLKT